MNAVKLSVLLSIFVLILFGCKKEGETIVDPHVPNIAPFTIPQQEFVIDEIIYGPSVKFPNAALRITFENSTLEYAFNKVPETGMYHMVPNFNTNYSFDNQMATVRDSGSFLAYSSVTQTPEVYIKNYNNQLIISYCDIENSTPILDQSQDIYLQNKPSSLNVRMNY